jgi:glycosyltransferase involved in cell wall biosynthesis
LGDVTNVPALLATAGLFVLPSRTEGISLTLLEAMATGLPVVATRVGGTPEVISQPNLGTLVPPSDPIELAHAIVALRRNADRARDMGRDARRHVEQHFSVHKMVAAYESLYCSTIAPPISVSAAQA